MLLGFAWQQDLTLLKSFGSNLSLISKPNPITFDTKNKKNNCKQQFLTKHSKNNITHKHYNVIYSVFPTRLNIIYNYKCFWKEKKISF